MKKIILLLSTLICQLSTLSAQETKEQIRTRANGFAQQGDYDAAIQVLDAALLMYPNDLDLMNDEMYDAYLNRDYTKALDIGKSISQNPLADEQAYQVLGMNYKAIADYKGADKMYKAALKKFPRSGTLYSEYGDMLAADKNEADAIKQWEKGIEADPTISSNYYYAAKYYAKTGNILWGLIYGEIFINTESLTKRTTEIKTLLANGYKKLIENRNNIPTLKTSGSAFEKALIACLTSSAENFSGGTTTDDITIFRSRFIINWSNGYANNFPYKLFQYQQMLMQEGFYDACNQWLFGSAINNDAFTNWSALHAADLYDFKQFQRSYLFKMPVEQYYAH